MPIEPYSLPDFYSDVITDLRERLARTRWLEEFEEPSWTCGIPTTFLRDLCTYWANEFDWKAQLQSLSRLPHYRYTTSDGLGIHFLHQRGTGPKSIPLLLTHGWPGSFLEMLAVLPLLTDPAKDGGHPLGSFDVIIPSLPGFGFSDRPVAPGMNVFRIADLWADLMDELGYERFAAQGGDLGAAVSTALGLYHAERMIGIHLNYIQGSYRPFIANLEQISPSERDALNSMSQWADENGAYAHLQRTRPRTAAYALNDSPAGLAAWILEKVRDWSDCNGDVLSLFTRDQLLTNVTLYWATQTIFSSFRLYYEGRKAPLTFGPHDRVSVPCAIAHFPKELPFPSQAWVKRGYNVQRWSAMPRGGHFAAMEQPELLVEDIRIFLRSFR